VINPDVHVSDDQVTGDKAVSRMADEALTLESIRAELERLLESRRSLEFTSAQQARYAFLCLHEKVLLATPAVTPTDDEEATA
jgi:hypothetical protein